jgi:hypothetical protein
MTASSRPISPRSPQSARPAVLDTRLGPLPRIALALLFVDEFVVGLWNSVAPESFYRYFPTVDLTPPFSEHYARDFGGATLGIALVLALAVIVPRATFALAGSLAYSVFAVPHFAFHLEHLQTATTSQALLLTAGNAVVTLVGLAVLAWSGRALLALRRAP